MQIESITTVAGLEVLYPEWLYLFEQCPDATPFQSPEWLLPWWQHLGGGELFVLALREQGRLVGVAPLFFHEWQGHRQVSPLGVSISDYFDFLLLSDLASEGTALIIQTLAAERSGWDICILPGLRDGSLLLNPVLHGGLTAAVEPTDICPVLSLPSSSEEFTNGLSAHHRRNLRRAQRVLDQAGGGQIEIAEANTVSEFIEALFRLHQARWRAHDDLGVLEGANVQAFHCDVAARFAKRGMLRLYGLRRNGVIASVMYDFASHNRVYAYLGGFDPALDRASPGVLLTLNAIQQSINDGYREYDFLRGAEDHKYVWGAHDRQNFRLVLTAP